MRERDIERILVDEVRRLGGRAYKWTSPGNAGVPDRIVILPGQAPIFAELKAEGGSLTKLQKVQILNLEKLRQDVCVIKGLTGLIEFFEGRGYLDTESRIRTRYQETEEG